LPVNNPNYFKYFKDFRHEIKEGIKYLKVIYSDLDGTLFNDQGCIIMDSGRNYYFEAVKLLEDIKQKGWDLVLVSGRHKHALQYTTQMIGIHNYIAELGCELIYNLGEEVHVTFDDKDCSDLTYGSRDLIRIIDMVMEEFPGRIESRMEWSHNRAYNALFMGEIDIVRLNKMLHKAGYKGLVFLDNGFSKLKKLDLDVERLHIYNLMPVGVTKVNGVLLDKKIRGFKKENCIALGDSVEDLKMAPETKYFFLMKNALDHNENLEEELKKHDNVYITEGAMNRGWFEVIRSLL